MSQTERLPILQITELGKSETQDTVVRESSATIFLNKRELLTLLCSPDGLQHLATGFLLSEGLLTSRDEIKKITVDNSRGLVQVETTQTKDTASRFSPRLLISSSGGRGLHQSNAATGTRLAKISSQMKVTAHEVLTLVKGFVQHSEVFKATGGVHSAALCDTKSILVFSEDIGRHNAIDKVFGQCFLEGIPTDDRILITSGRVSSEILVKVAKRNIPILISKSAPTNLGVRLANEVGITLIGFVRGKRMNVYANSWRMAI